MNGVRCTSLPCRGRNSLDGEGGNIIGIINMNDSETGGPMDNAYWNGAYMAFGNGNKILKPLAGALDVIGHELGHGVIDKTAGLVYRDQSGAMNESFADIFGAMIDREDWQIGEDITKPEVFPSGALRDLSNPHNGYISSKEDNWQPAHTSEIYTGEEDNGGVHINSGILNFAYYKYATATSKEEAEQCPDPLSDSHVSLHRLAFGDHPLRPRVVWREERGLCGQGFR